MLRSTVLCLTLLSVFGTTSLPVAAATSAPPTDMAVVAKAAAYLQELRSAEAKFSQTDPRGAVTTGTFSLQRPGKARFAYDPPADLTVVADGVNVDISDGKLKTFDQYPERQTPLALLLGSEVRFDKSVVIAAVSRDKAGFTITVRDAKKQAQGELSLSFSTAPMSLTGWSVLDPQGGKTTVVLSDLKSGVSLAPSLFVLHDPHPRAIKP